MEQEQQAQAGKKHTFECESCGASLTFSPGAATLECEYCGHQQAIPSADEAGIEREVVEYDFAEGLAKARRVKTSDLVQGGKEVQCNGCGAHTVMAEQSGNCPYCDTPMVAAVEDDAATMILPESVLPFKLDDRKARDAYACIHTPTMHSHRQPVAYDRKARELRREKAACVHSHRPPCVHTSSRACIHRRASSTARRRSSTSPAASPERGPSRGRAEAPRPASRRRLASIALPGAGASPAKQG